MTTDTYEQLELPLLLGPEQTVRYRPYILIDGRDAMETAEPQSTEAEAASILFFNANLMAIMLGHDGAKFEMTRRDPVSFTAYLYTTESGAQVVRGGIEWVVSR